jgi:hypothetical protein
MAWPWSQFKAERPHSEDEKRENCRVLLTFTRDGPTLWNRNSDRLGCRLQRRSVLLLQRLRPIRAYPIQDAGGIKKAG